jgi:hypothetical protein
VAYRADKVSFPMKFTHEQRTFDLELYVMMNEPDRAYRYKEYYLEAVGEGRYRSETIRENYPLIWKLAGDRAGSIVHFRAQGLNGVGKKLKALPSDPAWGP